MLQNFIAVAVCLHSIDIIDNIDNYVMFYTYKAFKVQDIVIHFSLPFQVISQLVSHAYVVMMFPFDYMLPKLELKLKWIRNITAF
jgi:hypothetical protein